YLRASIALAQQRNDSAAHHFTRTLEVLAPSDPTRARTMLRLAAALQDCNRQREAEQWYRRILELDPGNHDALLCLAVIREDSDVEEARGLMDRFGAAGRGRSAPAARADASRHPPVERPDRPGKAKARSRPR